MDTNEIMCQSKIRTASKPHERNLRADPINGDDNTSIPNILKFKHDGAVEGGQIMYTIEPTDLIGFTFLQAYRLGNH